MLFMKNIEIIAGFHSLTISLKRRKGRTGTMNQRIKHLVLAGFFSILLIIPSGVLATTYTDILSFGDSLSADNAATPTGTYSNGPVWVQDLSTMSGLPLTDEAIGGATTTSTTSNLGWQIANYLGPVSSSTLVTVWAGGNDLTAYLYGNAIETPAYAAGNLLADIQTLANEGFTNFFLPNLPNIGDTVRFYGTPYQAGISAWCQLFNSYLAVDLASLEANNPGDNFMTFDTYGLLTDVFNNPAAYGFSSVNDIFWTDGYHPSAQTHLLFAEDVYGVTGLPEPTTMLLLGLGLMGVLGIRRKIQK
jgi:phospholipase/lecithinase/hemolysin